MTKDNLKNKAAELLDSGRAKAKELAEKVKAPALDLGALPLDLDSLAAKGSQARQYVKDKLSNPQLVDTAAAKLKAAGFENLVSLDAAARAGDSAARELKEWVLANIGGSDSTARFAALDAALASFTSTEVLNSTPKNLYVAKTPEALSEYIKATLEVAEAQPLRSRELIGKVVAVVDNTDEAVVKSALADKDTHHAIEAFAASPIVAKDEAALAQIAGLRDATLDKLANVNALLDNAMTAIASGGSPEAITLAWKAVRALSVRDLKTLLAARAGDVKQLISALSPEEKRTLATVVGATALGAGALLLLPYISSDVWRSSAESGRLAFDERIQGAEFGSAQRPESQRTSGQLAKTTVAEQRQWMRDIMFHNTTTTK